VNGEKQREPSRKMRGRGSKFCLRTAITWQLGPIASFQDGTAPIAPMPQRHLWLGFGD